MSTLGFSKLFSLSTLMSTLVWGVRLGCIAAVIYVLVDAVWYFVAGPKDQALVSGYTRIAATQPERINTTNITSKELFGTSAELDKAEPVEALQATTLNLTLEGTFVAEDDSTHSVALISSRNNRDQAREYHEGDAIASFAELEAIHPRFVVISRGGERERLAFEADDILTESAVESTPRTSRESVRPAAIPRQSSPVTSRALLEHGLSADAIAEMPPNFNLDELMSLGLAEFQTEEGMVLQIDSSAESSLLSRLGMEPGDRVVSVNGHSLEAFRNDRQLVQEVAKSGIARLEIHRGGRQFFFSVPIQ